MMMMRPPPWPLVVPASVLSIELGSDCVNHSVQHKLQQRYLLAEFNTPEAATEALTLTGTLIQSTQNKQFKPCSWTTCPSCCTQPDPKRTPIDCIKKD